LTAITFLKTKKMKTIITLTCLLIGSVSLQAQSLKIKDVSGNNVTGDTVSVYFQPTQNHGWQELIEEFHVENLSASSKDLAVRKTEFNVDSTEYHSFCFGGMCFMNFTFISPFPVPVAGGTTDESFSGHYRFDDTAHTPGVCHVAYTFYDLNNTSDSAIVYVNYVTVLGAGIADHEMANVRLSDAWPNPSTALLHFNYTMDPIHTNQPAYLVISDVSGRRISQQMLENTNGALTLDVQTWDAGMYYYAVSSNGNLSTGKKFIVTH
jgi:hypothetical protein